MSRLIPAKDVKPGNRLVEHGGRPVDWIEIGHAIGSLCFRWEHLGFEYMADDLVEVE